MEILKGKVSWSIMSSYIDCRYMSYFDIVSPSKTETPEMKEGKRFHDWTDKYFDKYDKPPKKTFNDPKFEAFNQFEITRYDYCKGEGIPWKPVVREETYTNDFFLTKVDRIDDNGDGTYTLVEYKKKPYKKKDIPQMSFSTIIIEGHEFDISNWAIWYAEPPELEEQIYYRKPSTASMNAMKRKMSLVESSMKAGVFPADPGWSCKKCLYLEKCDLKGIHRLLCTNCGDKL